MKWIKVKEEYLEYLRKEEKRIPKTEYGSDKYKPFFGILFEKDDFCYITQVSHPQERHQHLKNQKDFFKIYDPKEPSRLIAVVNLNYMFPIPKNQIEPFSKNKINTYRTFRSLEEKSKYISLLDREIKAINNLNISKAAMEIYEMKYNFPEAKISQRCLDFKKLEQMAKAYQKTESDQDS